jgi:fused signal recognition particle receptor
MIAFGGTSGLEVPLHPATAACAAVLLLGLLWIFWRRCRRRRVNLHVGTSASVSVSARAGPQSSYARLHRGLAKTRQGVMGRLAPILARMRVDDDAMAQIETALLTADVGVEMTERLLCGLRSLKDGGNEPVRTRLEKELVAILEAGAHREPSMRPWVILVVGVNGAGKTTSIAKLAASYTAAGRSVLLVAADTFRAAAIEQLAVWAERVHAAIVRHQQGSDPAAVVHDGIRAAIARQVDVVIVDTAGRLHTKSNLMEELRKVRRIIARELPGAPHETLLVLDAVTGQNGVIQARAFVEALGVDGVVLTKLDGTAKGGIVVAITGELAIPIRYVGVGEGVDDLRPFDAQQFATALLAPGDHDSLDT